jgi:tripartite ATP-independent transporter DctM subunit
MEVWALIMLAVVIFALLLGYPVAFTLGGVALLFGTIFLGLPFFDLLPLRIWGIMTNFTLLAVPLFIFMGIILEKSGLAEELIEVMGLLLGRLGGGLAISVVIVGGMLAATTGVVAASVVTMGIISLPILLKNNYSPTLATGVIAASGTLGQIIPPSIVLILLADIIGVPAGSLFIGTIIPGIMLITIYILYIMFRAWLNPEIAPKLVRDISNKNFVIRFINSVIPTLLIIMIVLGSIILGIATPTESAAFGAIAALLLGILHKRLTLENLTKSIQHTTRLTSMVFLILIGATAFGLVFRGMGGDHLVHEILTQLPGGQWGFIIVSLLLIFILGFFLDFLEICFIVVPILAPIAQFFEINLLWFAVLIAVNLQTSFLTPPFGFSLFYLKAVAPPTISIDIIYRGIIPFVILQLIVLTLLTIYPQIILWLPNLIDNWLNFSV